MAPNVDSEKHQATQPLLEVENSLRRPSSPSQSRLRYYHLSRLSPWYLHGFLIFIYSALFVFVFISTVNFKDYRTGLLPLPARKALQWELRYFPTKIVDNPFAGEPRPELDEAWHDLLYNDNIRVAKNDLEALNLTSVYVKDGSDGIASLSVYHALHCLKKVRHMMYKEYYHEGKNGTQMLREKKHADHCVEYIREALMCKPDISLVTFRWINNTAQHGDASAFYPTNFDASLHECANWELLDSWANARVFDLYHVELLQRPEHGSEYANLDRE